MQHIKTILFDLDGTIYQNNVFHRDYLHFLLEGSGKESWAEELAVYIDEVYQGKHLKMNSLYAAKPLDAETPKDYFSELEQALLLPCEGIHSPMLPEGIYLGDAWAVVTLIGKTMGLLDGERCDLIYKKTREKMSRDGMTGSTHLRQTLLKLQERFQLVLLTNSYRETALDFLHQLGFDNVFQTIVFSAGKPWQAVENLKRCAPSALDVPDTVLSVGDNMLNDLLPFAELGCKTLWINPFQNICQPHCDATVSSVEELEGFLQTLYMSSVRLL